MTPELAAKLAKLGLAKGSAEQPKVGQPKVEQVQGSSARPALIPSVPETEAVPPKPELVLAATEDSIKLGPDVHLIKGFDPKLFKLQLDSLELAVKTSAPGIVAYLEKINEELNTYPELLQKLSPEKIAVIISGLLKQTGTNLAESISRKKGKLTAAEVSQLEF